LGHDWHSSIRLIDIVSNSPVQEATTFTKSAHNKTAAFPQLTINGMMHFADQLDSGRQLQA
jgi:hypothetical protein